MAFFLPSRERPYYIEGSYGCCYWTHHIILRGESRRRWRMYVWYLDILTLLSSSTYRCKSHDRTRPAVLGCCHLCYVREGDFKVNCVYYSVKDLFLQIMRGYELFLCQLCYKCLFLNNNVLLYTRIFVISIPYGLTFYISLLYLSYFYALF